MELGNSSPTAGFEGCTSCFCYTPLRQMHGCDVLHWQFSNDGLFSIKTDYRMMMEALYGDVVDDSGGLEKDLVFTSGTENSILSLEGTTWYSSNESKPY